MEFLSPKMTQDGESQGRSSGSAAWRVARGESGAGGSTGSSQVCFYDHKFNLFVFDVCPLFLSFPLLSSLFFEISLY